MTYAMLLLQNRGFRPIEALIGAFVSVIGVAYVFQLALAPPDWGQAAFHAVVPMLNGPDSVNISVGIIGATVMPHAIYLHSALTQNRMPSANDADRRKIIGFSNREVIIALGFAGLVNMAMLLAASSMFHAGHADVAEIETAYHTLLPLFGGAAAFAFMAALMASGLSSSVVGTMAGQVIMQDFVGFSIPLWVRRVVTMLPALAVVMIGFDATSSLIISQVILSLVLPIPMIALLVLTSRKEVMGAFVTGRRTRVLMIAATVLVLALNTVLLAQTAGLM
jgi:manganese transport protein